MFNLFFEYSLRRDGPQSGEIISVLSTEEQEGITEMLSGADSVELSYGLWRMRCLRSALAQTRSVVMAQPPVARKAALAKVDAALQRRLEKLEKKDLSEGDDFANDLLLWTILKQIDSV